MSARRLFRVLAIGWVALASAAAAAADTAPRSLHPGEIVRGRFVQERKLADFAKPLRSEGTFVLVPGRGLIWQGETPFKTTTVIAATGILQLVNGKEAMRLPASRLPVLSRFYEVLSGALSGDPRGLQREFVVSMQTSPEGWQLVLTPARPDDPALGQIASITLTGTELVQEVTIRKTAGDFDHLRFFDQSVQSVALSDEENSLLASLGP